MEVVFRGKSEHRRAPHHLTNGVIIYGDTASVAENNRSPMGE